MRLISLLLLAACTPRGASDPEPGVPGGTCGEDEIVAITADRGFSTIQQAIDAAAEDGRVVVCSGTHVERLWVTRSLTLEADRELQAIIDGAGAGRVLTAHAPHIEVLGLVLLGGRAEYGGNAHIVANHVTIDHCVIEGGHADLEHPSYDSSGGGLSLFGEGLIRDTVFRDNHATHTGGGLYASGRSPGWKLRMEGVRFEGNQAGREGGGAHLVSGDVQLYSSTFEGNVSGSTGGGLAANGFSAVELELHDVDLLQNTAKNAGGGLHIAGAASMNLLAEDLKVIGNTAARGGGLFAQSENAASITIVAAEVRGNRGGGAHLWAANDVAIDDSIFAGHEDGVALDVLSASLHGGSVIDNRVGIQIDEAGGAQMSSVDLGDDPEDNNNDVIYGTTAFQADGVATVSCSDGHCERR